MGNRLVLRSLEHLSVRDDGTKPLANIVFCAPDVGVKEFHQKAPRAVELTERVTLYTCLNDSALIASSKLNKEQRAGSTVPPTILNGVETIECSILDTSMLGHSYYGSNRSILRDLFCIVKEHKGASERKWLKTQDIPFHGPYWIFQDFPLNLEWTWHFDLADNNSLEKNPADMNQQ